MKFGRRTEHASETPSDHAFARFEAVDVGISVAWEEFFRRAQRGLDQVLRQRRAAGVPVNAVAGVVRVQRDNAVEGVQRQFGLQRDHLGLARV